MNQPICSVVHYYDGLENMLLERRYVNQQMCSAVYGCIEDMLLKRFCDAMFFVNQAVSVA